MVMGSFMGTNTLLVTQHAIHKLVDFHLILPDLASTHLIQRSRNNQQESTSFMGICRVKAFLGIPSYCHPRCSLTPM